MRDIRNEVKGDRNVVDQSYMQAVHIEGDKNNVNSNNRKVSINKTVIHIRAEREAAAAKNEPAIPFALLGLVVVAAWTYVRHLDVVIQYLRLTTMFSVAPALPAAVLLIVNLRRNVVGGLSAATTLFPFPSAMALLMMLGHVASLMPAEIATLASTKKAWDFWLALSDYGHQVLLQNLGATVIIVVAASINFLMGLHVLADQSIYANGPAASERLYAKTYSLRPARSGAVIVMLVAVVNLLATGEGVTLARQLLVLLKGTIS